jgi:signal transduction histidine kinase
MEHCGMNRKLLLQINSPAVVVGLLLLGTCLASAWYVHRLQTNLATILSKNVISLKAAQELEIRVRQLRFHSFIYLLDPKPERLAPMEEDHQRFEEALRAAEASAGSPTEQDCVRTIRSRYEEYRDELAGLRHQVAGGVRFANAGALADAHPLRHVVEPCQDLLKLDQDAMNKAAVESARLEKQADLVLLVLGIAGPLGGFISGLGIARGLRRSLLQLSIRVQGVAQRLDLDGGSVSIVVDGDIVSLDKQLQHVISRVEQVAIRLQERQRKMLRTEHLAAVGQLAASVAHEVRNPVTAVKMLVDLALRPQDPKPLTREDLGVIRGELARLEQTVQSFLDFARLPALHRTNCDVREVVQQAAGLVQARCRQQNIEVAVSLPDTPVATFVDRDQLRTVLVNLFLNALDAMPQGGRLEVTLEAAPDAETCITVADTGPGIAPEIAGRLFTPFVSTKPTGTGLGLSISSRIIEEHGGNLAVANRPEGGARFTLRLPADQVGQVPANGRLGLDS